MTNLLYRIALCNVFWSEQDINTRFFSSVEEQNTYFDGLTAGKFSSLLNFNMGDNINTSVTYQDNSNREVEDLVKCNYAVVQKYDKETGVIVSRRYFFAYPQQDSGRQMRVTLSLDDVQTNYVKYKDTIAPCMIRRANLNRWKDNNDGTVSFNGDVTSKLFEREPLQDIPKRLKSRKKISLNTYLYNDVILDNVNNWLDENVLYWVYAFFDPLHQYNFNVDPTTGDLSKAIKEEPNKTYINSKGGVTTGINSRVDTGFACFCFPIMKTQKFLYFDQNSRSAKNKKFRIYIDAWTTFLQYNNDASYLYDVKISSIPPFGPNLAIANLDSVKYEIDEDGNLHLSDNWGDTVDYKMNFQNATIYSSIYYNDFNAGLIKVNEQAKEVESKEINLTQKFTFTKNSIIGAKRKNELNPKLLSSDFLTLAIGDESGDYGEYDLQKLNTSSFKLIVTEPFSPGISKTYVRIKNPTGVYISATSENFTGFVGNNDKSITRATSQYASMLANSKNFFQQVALNGLLGLGKSTLNGALGGVLSDNENKTVGGAFSGFVNGTMQVGIDYINASYTADNMQNAPAQINASKGNAFVNIMTTEPGIYVSIYEVLENEKQISDDFITQYGYTVGFDDKITNFDNIRYYFNYIEADVETISAPISNIEKERLKQRLKSIRFWNSDTIQYDQENYERGLLQ